MQKELSKKEIINLVKTEKEYLKTEFGVISIGLFGSFANEKQNKDSDIDFLVELKEPRYDWLAGLYIHLEKKFNRDINLIRKSDSVKSRFIERLKKEVIYA